VRPFKVVARVALIAALAMVAVPGLAASGAHPDPALDPSPLDPVEVSSRVPGSAMTIPVPDPRLRSAGALEADSALLEPGSRAPLSGPTRLRQPEPVPIAVRRNTWRYDTNVSFYGPGFYGGRTACGLRYTRETMGVAHRSLPCGTKVQFRYRSRVITVPVIDRGPYVAGRTWDLSGGACRVLDHCWTGPIEWRYV
jgi:hypothetical protein